MRRFESSRPSQAVRLSDRLPSKCTRRIGISPAKQNPPARTGGHSTHARHTPLLLLG